jgi:acetolactate synthase-1/2/3 large subunit
MIEMTSLAAVGGRVADPPAGAVRTDVGTAARTLVASLVAHGVDRVFCLPGESYLAVLDDLYDRPEIDVVSCRHEASAAFAAVTDAKLTGRAGVCLVSRGPGATNASIAVHAAAQDATPLLVIVGHVPAADIGRGVFQELDCGQAFGGMAKASWVLHHPTQAAEFVARAFRVAESGTPGPVVLVVPEDVLEQPDPVGQPSQRWIAPASVPAEPDAATVLDMLGAAHRPLLIAGGRLSSPEGRRLLAAAADRHRLPVVTSNKNQDLFDNRHPLYAGHLHNNTQPAQRTAFNQADLVLAVGTRLDDVTTGRHQFPTAPLPRQPLIHVYPDGSRLGLVHRPAMGLTADPVAFLAALAAADPTEPPADRAGWIERLHGIETDKSVWRPQPAADGLAFGAVVTVLDELTGGDVTVAVDSGTFTSWVYRYLRLSGGGRLIGVSSSPMGFGVPAGVAAALRLRRPVVVVVGDGGFLMTGSELITAVAHRLPLVIVVANNGSYGTIRLNQERVYPGRTIATDLVNPDFVQLARAFGALGLAIEDEVDVEPCMTRALSHGGPVVIDVRTSLSWITAYRRLPDNGHERANREVP